MSYENSPACKLIATTCCCCGHPLVDAVSVEAGIGPDCRKKWGYVEAQLEPDWVAYDALIGDTKAAPRMVPMYRMGHEGITMVPATALPEPERTPRALANIITYRIAANIEAPTVRRDILALSALGFATLSAKLAKRVEGAAAIEITTKRPFLVLKTPYNKRLVEELRYVRGRTWDAAQKLNVFPVTSENELLNALRKIYFADTFVVRDGRVTALGGAR